MTDDTEAFTRRFNVSRETIALLVAYEALLRKWTSKINLVSKSTLDSIWDRHFADSAQLYRLIPEQSRNLCDFGSGGGFPGLVLAILARDDNPDLRVILIESDLRKASFLATVARDLDLNAEILAERVESAAPQGADVVTARALAPLDALLAMSLTHLAPDGIGLYLKGEKHQEEVDAARRTWDFDLDHRASETHPDAAVLLVQNLRRKE